MVLAALHLAPPPAPPVEEVKPSIMSRFFSYIDTKTLYAGTYFVKIIGANSVVNKKVIIEK